MKLAPLVFCLALLASPCLAQSFPTWEIREEVPDIHDVNGYTIRLFRMERDSYGYEIRRGPVVLVHQRRNPFTGSQMGLLRREDAVKTATWLLQAIVMREQMRPLDKRLPERSATVRFIPGSVAAALGITLDGMR